MLRAGHMLSWPAERYPDKVAITYQGRHMTFREVETRVNRLANGLMALGWQRGDRVAALLDNSPRAVEVRFALMKAGLCMVALNVRQAAAEHAYIINHSDSSLLILDATYLPVWEQIKTQCPDVRQVMVASSEDPGHYLSYEQVLATASDAAPQVMVALDDLERIAYTSGTTGRPKGIMKTIGNDLARMRIDFMNEDRLTTADDVMLNVAPFTHAARVFFRKHYLKGARNIILARFREEDVLETVQQERVTTAMFVPTMLIRLVLHPKVHAYDVSSLQRIFFGTAPMPVDKFKQAIRIFGNIFRQNYGLSEVTQPVTCLCPADIAIDGTATHLRRLASAGRPAIGVEVRIGHEHSEVAPEEEGEILIRGETVMPGYWKDPEATQQVIDAAGWLHTGDIGRRDDEGYIYIVDRKKDMIISGGFNIYPREVERVIEGHEGVRDVAVIGVPDAMWGEAVKAVVVLRPGARVTEAELIDLCKSHIASYKKPQSVDIVDALPKNFQGKILKRVLRERYVQGRDGNRRARDVEAGRDHGASQHAGKAPPLEP
jgi:long-chain acyl-CoA synthetase